MSRLILITLAAAIAVTSAQTDVTEVPTREPTTTSTEAPPTTSTEAASTTANPGLPYGSICNGFLARCNRHSETVACLQRRPAPSTTEAATESPILSLFRANTADEEICETGLTVDLGRCQCSRNCKNGIYVDDGEFDAEREICVGLVGSACSLVVPGCTANGRCNFLTSRCVCNAGFVDDGNRRCVAA